MDRWQSPFGAWVKRYGAARLARELQLASRMPVYHWVAGRNIPRPAHALRIVALAQGQVRFDDIYRTG